MADAKPKRVAEPFLTGALAGYYLLGYLLLHRAGLAHDWNGVSLAPWDGGVALSFVLAARKGSSWLPATVVAPLLAALLDGGLARPPLWTALSAVAEGGACIVAARLLRPSPDLCRLRHVLAFFAAAAIVAGVVGLAGGVEAVWDGRPALEAAELGGRHGLATAAAVITVAPFLLLRPPSRNWRRWSPPSAAELALQAVALAVTGYEVFVRFANREVHFFYLLFLPFAWIATRHGQRGTALALAAMFAAPLLSDRLLGLHDQAIIELHIRLVVLAATGLLLGAMVSERQVTEARMLARQTELAHFQRLNVGWEMASALAHELNQPLTAAMNYTQAASRLIDTPRPDLERAGAVMARAVDQIERVGHIIHGLRDFMRKGELSLARTAVADVVDDALRLVAAEANAGAVVLHAGGVVGLPAVMADKTQLVQVLVNLVRNAVQAIAGQGDGGGTVAVSGHVADGVVELTVADDGPGLSADVLARLFEPFVTTKPAGMGLGLSISKSIIEAHDGRLWADNGPAGGAVFHLTIPVSGDAAYG
ncbi:MAG: sensor histidine kinase [Actinomycetota bacterium]